MWISQAASRMVGVGAGSTQLQACEGWDHHPRPTWDLGKGSRKTHHVSVLDVNIPSMKASGGIHFTGSIAQPPFR